MQVVGSLDFIFDNGMRMFALYKVWIQLQGRVGAVAIKLHCGRCLDRILEM